MSPSTVVYRVRLFALLREGAGGEVWTHEAAARLTVAQLLKAFFDAHPRLEELRHVTRMAVGQVFCQNDALIDPADEIALIPPVSGG